MNDKKIALVCCSDGQRPERKVIIDNLIKILKGYGIEAEVSPVMYSANGTFPGTANERAQALMSYYLREDIDAICDISGGNLSNTMLRDIDFDLIKKHPKPFWGYSDLTAILNAIYAKTGQSGVLYCIKHLVSLHADIKHLTGSHADLDQLFQPEFQFLRGSHMQGVVIGGNIRCFLKLAGTEYMPDFSDKILLLEARSGDVNACAAHLSQLEQIGAFDKVAGVILGTFTQMERENLRPTVEEMLLSMTKDIPVAKTTDIGHAIDAKAIIIGEQMEL